MFVEISEPKAPLKADELFRDCYRKDKEITPEIAGAVLRSTNFKTCIERMLKCVDKLPAEKQAAFKEVVLAAFTHREQSAEAHDLGRKLAANGGYLQELKTAAAKFDAGLPFYGTDGASTPWPIIYKEGAVFPSDLGGHKKVVFAGERVNLTAVAEELENFNVSLCDEVGFGACNLGNIKSLSFKKNAAAVFMACKNLPADLDVSNCIEVRFAGCDLQNIKKLEFAEGAMVYLTECENIPQYLDFSRCGEVRLVMSDFSGVKEIKFADRDQQKMSMGVFDKGGKIVYAEDDVKETLKEAKEEVIEVKPEALISSKDDKETESSSSFWGKFKRVMGGR